MHAEWVPLARTLTINVVRSTVPETIDGVREVFVGELGRILDELFKRPFRVARLGDS